MVTPRSPQLPPLQRWNLCVGIHVHIWTSQQYEPALGESPGVGSTIADQRHNATTFALAKWRDGWVASKLHTHPAQTVGLYQEKGMMWWVLAKFLHEKRDTTADRALGGAVASGGTVPAVGGTVVDRVLGGSAVGGLGVSAALGERRLGGLKDEERVLAVLKILKAIHMTVERGGVKEVDLSPEVVNEAARSPRNVGVTEDEGLNSMTISYIMGRKAS